MDLKELMLSTCNSIGIDFNEDSYILFERYMELLLEWNEKMNLTAITDKEEIIIKHFCDSLSIIKYTGTLNGASLIDVGTGAGFPGIPLKIVFSGINVTLLDSIKKRVGFLQFVINELNLEGIEAVHMRAEDGASSPKYRQKYDYAVSRAVARMNVLSEYCIPYVKKGGQFVAYKGPEVSKEVSEAKKAIGVLGGKYLKTEEINLSGNNRSLVFVSKISDTSPSFPRKAGVISKKPLI